MTFRVDSGQERTGTDFQVRLVPAVQISGRVMGADGNSGSVTEGKLADVIAVRGDPLRYIDVLREPKLVIKHGRRVR